MAGYAAAMRAAQQRGINAPTVELRKPFPWHIVSRVVVILVIVSLVGGVGYLGWKWFGPKPPRYEKFPPTAEASAKEFLTHISEGDAGYDKAYFLIADSARSPKADVDDRGEYVQIFHNLNEYLTEELGPDWISRTQFAADPQDPNAVIATVDLETLHINTAQQSKDPQKPHFGILGIADIPVDYARAFGQTSAVNDIIRSVGGSAAEHNLQAIESATGGPVELRHAPVLVKKIMVLKGLRDPHSANGYSVAATDNFRTNGTLDPVVKARLEKIVNDGRYDGNVQDWAKKVLNGPLDETDRAGARLE